MLAACEMSGRVRDAFARRGWESWSADLLPSETPCLTDAEDTEPGFGYHYQGDVLELFKGSHPLNYARQELMQDGWAEQLWDLVIAFPPCTHLALSGARYWKEKQADGRQQAAAGFFMQMVNAPAPFVAVENPVGIMGRKKDPLYRVPDQVVQPWMFGDPLIKNTCLWLENLPLLRAKALTLNEERELFRVATGGGSYRVDKRNTGKANNGYEDSQGRKNRHIMRSLTPEGFAQAMADQWGPYVEEKLRDERLA